MMRRILAGTGLAMLVGVAAWAGGDLLWVDQGGETFDLSELADGETRVFEAGEKRIEATRNGETVTLRADRDSARVHDCDLSTTRCLVTTRDDRVFIRMERSETCEGEECESVSIGISHLADFGADADVFVHRACGDDEDCDVHARSLFGRLDLHGECEGDDCDLTLPGGHRMLFRSDCDGEDCNTFHAGANTFMLRNGCEGEDCDTMQFGGPLRLFFGAGGGIQEMQWKGADDIDGCPRGTRTMRFTDETAEDGYLCVGEGAAPDAGGRRVLQFFPGH